MYQRKLNLISTKITNITAQCFTRMFCMLKIIKIANVWDFKIMYENKSAIYTVNYNFWLLLCRNWGLESNVAVHIVVFCVVILCNRLGEYKRFKRMYYPLLQGRNEPSEATVRCWAEIHKTDWRICYTEEIKNWNYWVWFTKIEQY